MRSEPSSLCSTSARRVKSQRGDTIVDTVTAQFSECTSWLTSPRASSKLGCVTEERPVVVTQRGRGRRRHEVTLGPAATSTSRGPDHGQSARRRRHQR